MPDHETPVADAHASAFDPVERRVLDAIDVDALLACLGDLVGIESLGGRESAAQEHMAGLMRGMGFDVDLWQIDVDGLRRHPRYSAEIERDEALGVVGMTRGAGRVKRASPFAPFVLPKRRKEDGPTLVLNGHVDVEPAGDLMRWTKPPWRATFEDGRVYGRGACDMKGPLLCGLFALNAIRAAGVELKGRVLFHSVVGEEDGGMGTLATIERGHVGDAAIVLEPTGLAVAPSHAGAQGFVVTIPGRAAHAALRTEGVNPIDAFVEMYRAIQELERRIHEDVNDYPLYASYERPFALSVGRLHAGERPSSVPEALVFEGRVGVPPGRDPLELRAMFEETIMQVARGDVFLREHPPIVEWDGGQFDPAFTDPAEPVVTAIADAVHRTTGRLAEIKGMTYGADMQLLVNEAGMPCTLFGPGDIRLAHAPDEYIEVTQMEAATRAIALAVMRFCGVAKA